MDRLAPFERDPAYIAYLYRRAEYWEREVREAMARGLRLDAASLERQLKEQKQ